MAMEAGRGRRGRDKIVEAEIKPLKPKRGQRDQTRPLRPDEAVEAKTRPC